MDTQDLALAIWGQDKQNSLANLKLVSSYSMQNQIVTNISDIT